MCKVSYKILKFEFLAFFFNLLLRLCLVLTWDLMRITGMGNHGAAGGISERRRSSFFSPTPAFINRMWALCQATCVQSHQRQPMSAVAIATYEVQVLAADSLPVPTVATGVSKPLCCRLTLTFSLTSGNVSLYLTLLLCW